MNYFYKLLVKSTKSLLTKQSHKKYRPFPHVTQFQLKRFPLARKNSLLTDNLIGQPYWTALFHKRDLHIVNMNLYQLTRISHNAGFSRNQTARYARNRCRLYNLCFFQLHNWRHTNIPALSNLMYHKQIIVGGYTSSQQLRPDTQIYYYVPTRPQQALSVGPKK